MSVDVTVAVAPDSAPVAISSKDDADPTYTHFIHKAQCLDLIKRLQSLLLDEETNELQDKEEENLVKDLGSIFDHYLPLPTLIDPALSQIIPPLMEILGQHLGEVVNIKKEGKTPVYSNTKRLARLGRVLFWIVKVRGRKGVITYFPPEIQHLPVLLAFLGPESGTAESPFLPIISDPDSWQLRSLLLLWLFLLLTVPFPLASFDPAPPASSPSSPVSEYDISSNLSPLTPRYSPTSAPSSLALTARRVLRLALPLLFKAGIEGEYAALLLARLMARSDVITSGLDGFLDWVSRVIQEDAHVVFLTNILAFLALLPGLATPDSLETIRRFYLSELLPVLQDEVSSTSGLLRKMAVKAEGRWWIARLGGSGVDERRRRMVAIEGKNGMEKGSTNALERLDHTQFQAGKGMYDEDVEMDLPDGVEEFVDRLMNSLSDKDTIVRYSSAKYLSRLSVLLPPSMSSQIVSAVISLFAGSEVDPVVMTDKGKVVDPGGGPGGEGKWHGVCLALAEMARRGLIASDHMSELLPWTIRSLKFDIRRGAHSIGSNVRDAAAYLVWSLARAMSPEDMQPFALDLARTLVTVACLDREVGVRRAASAAFQEHVGRMGLFPHGIEVLGKTDFFMVSVRRSAFLDAAPQVSQYPEYRSAILDHLHDFTLRHWDPAMRELGAQALEMTHATVLDLPMLEASVDRELAELRALDTDSIHGGIVGLTRMSELLQKEKKLPERLSVILSSLSTVRPAVFAMRGSDPVLKAACDLITASMSAPSSSDEEAVSIAKKLLELSMKSRKDEVQRAAAHALGALSKYIDCSIEIKR